MSEAVMRFRGEYDFLSNMYEAPFTWDGRSYRCSEAAFQSAKTKDPAERDRFSALAGVTARREGKKLKLRKDWERVKQEIMDEVLRAKFIQNPELLRRLEATGDRELKEGNQWHDTYWGVDASTGEGENRLGRLLMALRDEARGLVVWERTVRLELTAEEKRQRLREQRQEQMEALSAEMDALSWPELAGREMKTKAFGTVTILGREGLVLRFLTGGEEKRFLLPDCVLNGFLTPDPDLMEVCSRMEELRKRRRELALQPIEIGYGSEYRREVQVRRYRRIATDPGKEEQAGRKAPFLSLAGAVIFLREGEKLTATAEETLRHHRYYNEGTGTAVLLSSRTAVLIDQARSPAVLLDEARSQAFDAADSPPDFQLYDMDDGCGLLYLRGTKGIYAFSPTPLNGETPFPRRDNVLPRRASALRACERREPLAVVYFNAGDTPAGLPDIVTPEHARA